MIVPLIFQCRDPDYVKEEKLPEIQADLKRRWIVATNRANSFENAIELLEE